MKQEKLKLYSMDMKYVRNLHNADDRVQSVSPQIHKSNRPLVGIISTLGKRINTWSHMGCDFIIYRKEGEVLKMKQGCRRVKKCILLFVLTVAMVLGMVLMPFMLGSMEVQAEGIPDGLQVDSDYSEGQDGYYYMNLSDEKILNINNSKYFTFKIYDDGGKNGAYSSFGVISISLDSFILFWLVNSTSTS